MLTFDPEDHIYRLNGQKIASVTQILKAAGLIEHIWYHKNWDKGDSARVRGTLVHCLCELHDKGELGFPPAPEFSGYLDAWIKFRSETGWDNIERPELRVWSELGFAGTIDRVGAFRGEPLTILDIKTGQPARWHGLQLAAYAIAYKERLNLSCPSLPPLRFTIHLTKDGKYKVKEYIGRNDAKVFRAILTLQNWRKKT